MNIILRSSRIFFVPTTLFSLELLAESKKKTDKKYLHILIFFYCLVWWDMNKKIWLLILAYYSTCVVILEEEKPSPFILIVWKFWNSPAKKILKIHQSTFHTDGTKMSDFSFLAVLFFNYRAEKVYIHIAYKSPHTSQVYVNLALYTRQIVKNTSPEKRSLYTYNSNELPTSCSLIDSKKTDCWSLQKNIYYNIGNENFYKMNK